MTSPAGNRGGLFIPIGSGGPSPQHRTGRSSLSSSSVSNSGWPLSSSIGGGGNGGGGRLSSSSGGVGGGGGGSSSYNRRRAGSQGSSFGGRNNDGAALLREVKEVLSRIRWDLAEATGVPFEEVRVFLSDHAAAVAGEVEDGEAEERLRFCRQYVREGRCGAQGHCRYSHAMTLAPLGTRPSAKSAGSMAPLRVLEGYDVEAAMGAGAAASASLGASSGGGMGGSIPSFGSASPSAAAAPLYRAVFVEYGGRIVWDKEHPDVWERFLAGLDGPLTDKEQQQLQQQQQQQQRGGGGGGGMGLPPAHPAIPIPRIMRRNSSADSLLLQAAACRLGSGNRLLPSLPHDVFMELFGLLDPGDCARCLRTCRAWSERAGDPALWARFLLQRFDLPSTYRPPSPSPPPVPPSSRMRQGRRERGGLLHVEEELAALAIVHPPLGGDDAPTPAALGGQCERRHYDVDVLQDRTDHPRREYGRLAQVCRNARALCEWNGWSHGGGGGSGSSGGGGSGGRARSGSTAGAPSSMAAPIPFSSPSSSSAVATASVILSSSPSTTTVEPPRSGTPASTGSGSEAEQQRGESSSSRRATTTQQHVVQRFHGHDRGAVIALYVDEAGDRLISGDVAGSVRLWELHSGARLATVDLRTHLTCLAADEWTIYVGTLKGALATVNREDMADVQAHKLGQNSNISALCLLPPRPAQRRPRHHPRGAGAGGVYGRRSASPLFSPLGSSAASASSPFSLAQQQHLRTPSPLTYRKGAHHHRGHGQEGEEDDDAVRPRLVVGFGNGSFLLLHGTARLLLLHPPHAQPGTAAFSSSLGSGGGAGGHSSLLDPHFCGGSYGGASSGGLSSSLGSGSSVLPAVQHHLYALPVSHPACVFLAATGPRSFVAAACPDRLFLWSAATPTSTTTAAAASQQTSSSQQPELLQLPALSLTCALSPAAVAGWDSQGRAVMGRHALEACCDVAVLAILPEEGVDVGLEEEEEGSEWGSSEGEEELDLDVDVEDDEDPLFPTGGGRPRGATGRRGKGLARRKGAPKGGGGNPPALVVTACDHDVALRWWELTSGRDAAVCTAVVPAFAVADPPAGNGAVGTLSLAQAGGILLSAHLDGSLVVWHVGGRRPVARFGALPLLESLALTPRALGLLCCFERHIVLARDVTAYGCAGGAAYDEAADEWAAEDGVFGQTPTDSASGGWGGSVRRKGGRRGRRQSASST